MWDVISVVSQFTSLAYLPRRLFVHCDMYTFLVLFIIIIIIIVVVVD